MRKSKWTRVNDLLKHFLKTPKERVRHTTLFSQTNLVVLISFLRSPVHFYSRGLINHFFILLDSVLQQKIDDFECQSNVKLSIALIIGKRIQKKRTTRRSLSFYSQFSHNNVMPGWLTQQKLAPDKFVTYLHVNKRLLPKKVQNVFQCSLSLACVCYKNVFESLTQQKTCWFIIYCCTSVSTKRFLALAVSFVSDRYKQAWRRVRSIKARAPIGCLRSEFLVERDPKTLPLCHSSWVKSPKKLRKPWRGVKWSPISYHIHLWIHTHRQNVWNFKCFVV